MRFDIFRRHTQDTAPMPLPEPDAGGYVTYTQLLDPARRVMGYRMGWRPAAPGAGSDAVSRFKALATCVGEHLNDGRGGWALGRTLLFFDMSFETIVAGELQMLPAENVVLCIGSNVLDSEDLRPILLFMREQGFGFMLCGADALPQDDEARSLITHFDVGTGEPQRVQSLRAALEPGHPPIQFIATQVGDWQDFDACAAQQIDVFVEGQALVPAGEEDEPGSRTLQPEAMAIVNLMQMIQRNDELRDIESVLKRDAVLTYRLLRYINSPAIGAGVEIHSLRHAVTMLGYAPLLRWLSVLLATSNAKASPPFMTKKAIMRGRFVELMGKGMLSSGDADNLFVVGMFSLIDRLLGVPMAEVVRKVQLNEAVLQAILSRDGAYGPFLSLAESCEEDGARAASLAESLFLSADQVNAAHLAALAWAQDLAPVVAE